LNLAGEYMDVVIAMTLEWKDYRLQWNQFVLNAPVKVIDVHSEDIWTPHIDIANRMHDISPMEERYLDTTVRFDGKIFFCKLTLLILI